jgi:hypothetical protein
VGSAVAREKRKSDQTGLVQPVLEFSQVLQLPYSNISWRLLKSRDHSRLSYRCVRILQLYTSPCKVHTTNV